MGKFILREEILKEHSKAQCAKIVKWVGCSEERFDELFNLFINDEYRVTQRTAWPLSYCVINHPQFIRKKFAALVNNLNKPNIHDAVKRNTLRLIQHVAIPKRYHGSIMDHCFQYLESQTEPVAIKSFSLKILRKMTKEYPEIKPEIKLVIEHQLPYQTAAFKSSAREFLKDQVPQ